MILELIIPSFILAHSQGSRRADCTLWIKRIVIAVETKSKEWIRMGRVARELGSLSLYSHYNLIRIFLSLVRQLRKYEALYLCPALPILPYFVSSRFAA